MKKAVIYECDTLEQGRFDGSVDKQKLKRLRSTITLAGTELKKKGMNAVLQAYEGAGRDMADQQSRFFFQRFEEIAEEAGQSVDAGGRPFSFDLWLEGLDGVELDFADNGDPVIPTVVCAPAHAKAMQEWEITDEQVRRFEELIERKRRIWRDRESDRRLVD